MLAWSSWVTLGPVRWSTAAAWAAVRRCCVMRVVIAVISVWRADRIAGLSWLGALSSRRGLVGPHGESLCGVRRAKTRSPRLSPPNGELADGARLHWADELLDLGARLARLDGPHNLGGPDDDQPWVLPALVIDPCTREVPEENSLGTRPT